MIIIIQAVVLDFHRYECDESGPLLFIEGEISVLHRGSLQIPFGVWGKKQGFWESFRFKGLSRAEEALGQVGPVSHWALIDPECFCANSLIDPLAARFSFSYPGAHFALSYPHFFSFRSSFYLIAELSIFHLHQTGVTIQSRIVTNKVREAGTQIFNGIVLQKAPQRRCILQ